MSNMLMIARAPAFSGWVVVKRDGNCLNRHDPLRGRTEPGEYCNGDGVAV